VGLLYSYLANIL